MMKKTAVDMSPLPAHAHQPDPAPPIPGDLPPGQPPQPVPDPNPVIDPPPAHSPIGDPSPAPLPEHVDGRRPPPFLRCSFAVAEVGA